ncbi:type II toxin-antitoxin system RelE/ParE family toxin [Candidatus Nanohalococcus occultus]|uniref:Addiction module toxin RelE n=1 Tax=Candidatus Nanohalococcus occultus TaxID=2978047 RepID=A0ABY8CD36_9ARCH|nr:hypothetical protein SVXNc_0097 [Candidatus Nanohaloarchaeota archaeon SVXNc]
MKITEEAEKDIDAQEDYNRRELALEIKERLTGELDRDHISYISKPQFGIEFHRLKLKENGLDHRVYFDYNDSETVVFAVRHRDYLQSGRSRRG